MENNNKVQTKSILGEKLDGCASRSHTLVELAMELRSEIQNRLDGKESEKVPSKEVKDSPLGTLNGLAEEAFDSLGTIETILHDTLVYVQERM